MADSNDAYTLLGLIIEIIDGIPCVEIKVTEGQGLTFEKIIERDIFGPLDMTHSFYDPSSMKEWIVVPKNESRQDIISVDYDVNLFNAYTL